MEGKKRLVRSKRNKVFLGVLGGIAEYFNVDPTLIRLIFIVLLVLSPVTMTILYFLAAIVMPGEDEAEKPVEERLDDVIREVENTLSSEEKNDLIKALALILIILGSLYLLTSALPLLFMLKMPSGNTLLALLLLGIGIILLMRGE
ncbi:PspC domain-containing protein [Thermococcus sp.]